ncbi:hypothetical protein BU23DRAFT_563168 [Bimuria novae-zelandiae CBS 107.79]|uniref:Uncharacterized protein n=1 Tax=Bimuria novae-zelandiae CBS 107.79 TaxID=1447943 RepID=A0A6A5VR26_9PLEO|nr:hypothetical protein BU23DRAFT_563168 [Bimuria novae-zelandiae CBS 107.79]
MCAELTVRASGVTSNFIFDNRITGEFEYVREISPLNTPSTTDPETLLAFPNTNPDSTDLICGRNASTAWGNTKTATVAAGDSVGFFVGRGISYDPPNMYHPGFASAWLSKAEDGNLAAYKGDGKSSSPRLYIYLQDPRNSRASSIFIEVLTCANTGPWYKIHQTTNRTAQSVDFTDPVEKPYYDPIKSVWGVFRARSVRPPPTPSSTLSLKITQAKAHPLLCTVELHNPFHHAARHLPRALGAHLSQHRRRAVLCQLRAY